MAVTHNIDRCDRCKSTNVALSVIDIIAQPGGGFLPVYPRRAYCGKCAEKIGDKAFAKVYRQTEVIRW